MTLCQVIRKGIIVICDREIHALCWGPGDCVFDTVNCILSVLLISSIFVPMLLSLCFLSTNCTSRIQTV